MSVPSSAVDICNIALDYIAQKSIVTNIEDPQTEEEVILARHYDTTRRATLRELPWNFAKQRAVIARSGTPAFDYTDAFTLPNDCLRVLTIGDSGDSLPSQDYDVQARDLLINGDGTNSLKIRYVQDVKEVSQFDSLFIEVLAKRLALKVAYRFTLKKGIMDTINAMLSIDERAARGIDGQERPPRRVQTSKIQQARRSFTSGGYYASPYTVFTR